MERLSREEATPRRGVVWPNGVVLAATIASVSVAAACTPPQPTRGGTLEAVQTSEAIRVLKERVFWLDADTLVFAGTASRDVADNDDDDPASIYLWKPFNGPETLYREAVWTSPGLVQQQYFCASDGRLTYSRSGAGTATSTPGVVSFDVMEGPPGQERPAVRVSYFLKGNSGDLNESAPGLLPYNRIWYPLRSGLVCDEGAAPEMVGRFWAATASAAHRIVFDSEDGGLSYEKARLWDARTGKETPLPVPDHVTAPSCVFSTPWDGAAWFGTCKFSGTWRARPADAWHVVWRLDPASGEIEALNVPKRPSTFFGGFAPTKKGVLFYSSESTEEDGLFRLIGGRRELLVAGEFVDVVVSPGGCKIALFEIISSRMADYRLVVADVCKEL
jgi:hypothetical protein